MAAVVITLKMPKDPSTAAIAYRLFEPGANLHPVEASLACIAPLWFLALSGDWGNEIYSMAKWNATCQLGMFIIIVQIPTLITGHMSYVDIGWPLGLCVLAGNAWIFSKGGNQIRSLLICGALLIHGGRMFLGSLFMTFPYIWKDEFFPRYKYARTRFIDQTGATNLWWLKQQHDTFVQCAANCFFLAMPIIIIATNPNTELHLIEVLGFLCWLISYIFENIADLSKLEFIKLAKKNCDTRTAVLGYPPYDTSKFVLWTFCRHPNYFGEWCCWNSFCLMALPSAFQLSQDSTQHKVVRIAAFVILYLTSRFFYDCLVYWTGAAPAEFRSVQRRPAFKSYQLTTNVLFPFSMPFFNHHRTSGWPNEHEPKQS